MVEFKLKTPRKTQALLAKVITKKRTREGHMVKHNKMREEAHQGLRETVRAAPDLTIGVNVTIAEIEIAEIPTPILLLSCMLPD